LVDQVARLAASNWVSAQASLNLPFGFFLLQNRDFLTPALLADLPRKILALSLLGGLALVFNYQLERYAFGAIFAMGLILGGLLSNAYSLTAHSYVLNWLGFHNPLGGWMIFVPADLAQGAGIVCLSSLFGYILFLRLREILVNYWRQKNGLPVLE
jgi:lipoprotein signal peptidase